MSDKNELMTTGSGFLALADFNMNESMAEELEGLEGGFDRVKIPSGGAPLIWMKIRRMRPRTMRTTAPPAKTLRWTS